MSIRKYLVPDFKEQLEILARVGFKDLNAYRKAEALVGESKTVDLIQLYFSEQGRAMVTDIERTGNIKPFIADLWNITVSFPKATLAQAFVEAHGRFMADHKIN